jgi:16S rRNA (adenine1518-N6/adenine1519-N6)-dimethyltransferase
MVNGGREKKIKMIKVYPKKNLGQHFLKDKAIAQKISSSLTGNGYTSVLEIGPGMGILTEFILKRGFEDFLAFDIEGYYDDKLAVIGNFPYNISSQIFFRILDHRGKIVEVVGMLQKEVAERICAGPGSKTYGILSVLIQAFYYTEYLFSVSNNVFSPPPKVQSGVIRLTRNNDVNLDCDEGLFFRVVKACFNQRRKTLRNSIKSAFEIKASDYHHLHLRPEQLSVNQFMELTNWIEKNL